MRRNHHKYQAMVMEKTQVNPVLSCENTVIPTGNELELLAVTVVSEFNMKSRHMQESEPANEEQ